MNRHESKDSCCRLLVTFKVKESTIYFKSYRISSLQEAVHTDRKESSGEWHAGDGSVLFLPKSSSSSFLSTKEFFNLDCTWDTRACMGYFEF